MSDEPIKVELNDKEIFEILDALSKRVKNLKTVMRQLTHVMKEDIEENFETEGVNITGKKWESWSDGWRAKRLKMGKTAGILTLEGDLRKSFVRRATDTTALVGTNKEYAAIHNFGGAVKKRTGKNKAKGSNGSFDMPRREFARFHDGLKAKILTEVVYELHIQDYLDEEAEKLKRLKGDI